MLAEPSLTAKETEVLGWLAAGKTLKEIAEILAISSNTVGFHQKNIYRKLDVSNRVSAVERARSMGWLKSDESPRKRAVQSVYDAFVAGDPTALFDLMHDDIEWISDAPRNIFPHAGRTMGKQAAIERVAIIGSLYEPLSFAPRSFVEDGNELSVLLDVELRHRESGKPMIFDVAHFWTFEGAHAVGYREVFNSGSLMEQMAIEPQP